MGGGNGQKSKMARERNAEKNKASKGTHALLDPSRRFVLIHLNSMMIINWGFFSIPCRQPARGQQEGHEHPGACRA